MSRIYPCETPRRQTLTKGIRGAIKARFIALSSRPAACSVGWLLTVGYLSSLVIVNISYGTLLTLCR
jgi:hypothetical protein